MDTSSISTFFLETMIQSCLYVLCIVLKLLYIITLFYFRAGLTAGLSQHWSESLKVMTGETEINANAILEYFAPLYEFMKKENAVYREKHMETILSSYSETSSVESNKLSLASWDTQTDVNNEEKRQAYLDMVLKYAEFTKENYDKYFKDTNIDEYQNEDTKRQLKFLTKMGVRILDEGDLNELTKAKSEMQKIYNTGLICPYEKLDCDFENGEGLELDPGNNNNYNLCLELNVSL